MIKIQVMGSANTGKTSISELIKYHLEKYGVKCEIFDEPYLDRKFDFSDIEMRMKEISKKTIPKY